MRRKFRQLGPDLLERKSNTLRKNDERDPPKDRSGIPTLAASGSFRCDQAALFIEA
jgi:hypothetical protein